MKNVNLRLDDDLHAALKDAAKSNNRSLQQQIIWQLKGPYIHLLGRGILANQDQEEDDQR